ncbi:hypothetical protein EDB92DRAFT_1818388 [Lactarius akahatsu]|uniref:Uncharacterized protein n=1 Tax=Lactarius akahatsu TaxID=416441 RepID=A0AAD4LBY7_9AGAM|nr:hypothetical protein EDB92DRAFT_1818388 [Lactarius akahatsu]
MGKGGVRDHVPLSRTCSAVCLHAPLPHEWSWGWHALTFPVQTGWHGQGEGRRLGGMKREGWERGARRRGRAVCRRAHTFHANGKGRGGGQCRVPLPCVWGSVDKREGAGADAECPQGSHAIPLSTHTGWRGQVGRGQGQRALVRTPSMQMGRGGARERGVAAWTGGREGWGMGGTRRTGGGMIVAQTGGKGQEGEGQHALVCPPFYTRRDGGGSARCRGWGGVLACPLASSFRCKWERWQRWEGDRDGREGREGGDAPDSVQIGWYTIGREDGGMGGESWGGTPGCAHGTLWQKQNMPAAYTEGPFPFSFLLSPPLLPPLPTPFASKRGRKRAGRRLCPLHHMQRGAHEDKGHTMPAAPQPSPPSVPPHLHGRVAHEGMPPPPLFPSAALIRRHIAPGPSPSHLATPPCMCRKGDGTQPLGALHVGHCPFPLVRTAPYAWKGHATLATPPSFPIRVEGARTTAHRPASPPHSPLLPFPLHTTQTPPFPLAAPPCPHGECECTPPLAPLAWKGCMRARRTACTGKGHVIPDPTLPHSHGRGCTQARHSVHVSRGSQGQAVSGSRTGAVSMHPHPIFTHCSTT